MSFVKLDRALDNWRYKAKPNYVALWIDILTHANYQDKKWEKEMIHAGEFVTSREHLAKRTGLSVQQVRTILKELNGEELTIKTTNKYTLIKVNKWAQYQCNDDDNNQVSNHQITIKQPTNNQQITTTKEYIRNIRNIRNKELINNIPIYDTSINKNLTESELNELLEMRKV